MTTCSQKSRQRARLWPRPPTSSKSSRSKQLEVEKNSKDEAVREAEETLRQLYENEVSELQFQVKTLKEHRDLPVTHSTELRRQDSRVMNRCSSRPLNRSNSRDGSVCPLMARSKKGLTSSTMVEGETSLELKMCRKMLLQLRNCERDLLQFLTQLTEEDKSDLREHFEVFEQQSQELIDFIQSPVSLGPIDDSAAKIQELTRVVDRQQSLISHMRIYELQLEEMVKALTGKIFQNDGDRLRVNLSYQEQLEQSIERIGNTVSRWKSQKTEELESENKQLRGIIDEMILLMKKKKLNSSMC